MDYQFVLLAFTSLFAIINPVGLVPIYVALTSQYTHEEKLKIIKKTTMATLLILVTFALMGKYILLFFGISIQAFSIAGGILLFTISLDMLHGKISGVRHSKTEQETATELDDIAVIPLAMPLLAGPGAITSVIVLMTKAQGYNDKLAVLLAIFLCVIAAHVTLKSSEKIEDRLSPIGIKIMTRMMGLILAAISVQMMLGGIKEIFF
ncbi:MAG: multiple antibiotic resistance protein [Methanothermococcus sp.]|nr:multiple antibiotic resistance protein [Methanothermococcus sp.]